ncbi:uncharacterized protein LOC100203086 [Hydra vulgaris]|uniref:uncharacterized protein LOC100203086 n=1 Tax=Hydra vulgaris TaxID=6087 RepID=UPI000640DA8F|nr:probable sodium/metabolite cotransporter BASS4, chloroplastic [Hydra vulgaris]
MSEHSTVICNVANDDCEKVIDLESHNAYINKSNLTDVANQISIGVDNFANDNTENYSRSNSDKYIIKSDYGPLNSDCDELSNDKDNFRNVIINSVNSNIEDSVLDCNLNKHHNNEHFSNDFTDEARNKDEIKENEQKISKEFTHVEILSEKNNSKNEKKNFSHKAINKLEHLLLNNFLPISFIAALLIGIFLPQVGNTLNHKSTTYICLVFIFLYSGLYLPSSAIKDSIKAYKAAAWGFISILFFSCIIGSQLTMLIPFHKISSSLGTQSFKTGLVVYFCSPCTVSSGVLMITQLKGNYALAVLLTVATNVVGIFTSPLLLKWMLKTEGNFNFDVISLLTNLLLSLLLPLVIGKLLRFVKVIKEFSSIPKLKLCFMLLNIIALALIVTIQVSQTSQNGGLKRLTVLSTVIIIAWSLTVHIVFLLINATASWLLRLEIKQTKCIVVLSSQKTASIAIGVLTFFPKSMGDRGLMAISIIIAHISMLLFDSLLVPLWIYTEKRMERKKKKNSAVTFSNPENDTKF